MTVDSLINAPLFNFDHSELQYRSSFQSSTLIGRAVTRSQTSLGVRARFRLGFRAGYDVFRMYAVLISTNQIRALKITPGYIDHSERRVYLEVKNYFLGWRINRGAVRIVIRGPVVLIPNRELVRNNHFGSDMHVHADIAWHLAVI